MMAKKHYKGELFVITVISTAVVVYNNLLDLNDKIFSGEITIRKLLGFFSIVLVSTVYVYHNREKML